MRKGGKICNVNKENIKKKRKETHTIEYYLTMRRETGHGTYHNKRMTNENIQIKEVRN